MSLDASATPLAVSTCPMAWDRRSGLDAMAAKAASSAVPCSLR
nr:MULTISPECIES: hypothetical protein [Sphingomonas]